MSARAAPSIGVVLSLVLLGAGPSHALSLRSSAAESFLGDASPGTSVAYSRAVGAKLRVENAGADLVRVEFKAVPPASDLKDGWEPWPHPEAVRIESSRAELKPGAAAEAEVVVNVPKDRALNGGQYQFDVLATGYDRSGGSLSLRTRLLIAVGPPPASPVASVERPGFALSPLASGKDTLLKFVNAGDEDLSVTLSPARSWDDGAHIQAGYEPAPNPRWLRFDPGSVTVPAGAIGRARIWAAIPRQARYAGRHWAFVVAVDADGKSGRTRRWYVLHVDTSDMEVKPRGP